MNLKKMFLMILSLIFIGNNFCSAMKSSKRKERVPVEVGKLNTAEIVRRLNISIDEGLFNEKVNGVYRRGGGMAKFKAWKACSSSRATMDFYTYPALFSSKCSLISDLMLSVERASGLQLDDELFETYAYLVDFLNANYPELETTIFDIVCGQEEYINKKNECLDGAECEKAATKKTFGEVIDWLKKECLEKFVKVPANYGEDTIAKDIIIELYKRIEEKSFMNKNVLAIAVDSREKTFLEKVWLSKAKPQMWPGVEFINLGHELNDHIKDYDLNKEFGILKIRLIKCIARIWSSDVKLSESKLDEIVSEVEKSTAKDSIKVLQDILKYEKEKKVL